MSKRAITISVWELVEFVLRTGDLGMDRDFFGPTRALEGTRGHQRLQSSRPKGYQSEFPLSHPIEIPDFVLTVSGRVDGILQTADTVLIEEIKTVRGHWAGEADPLHWAQAKIYAFIYLTQQDLRQMDVQLTYLDLDSESVTPFRQSFGAEELNAFFAEVTRIYVAWLADHIAWWQLRDSSIRSLSFPFPEFRQGQQALVAAASNAFVNGSNMFVEAPTGIGKTISVLFPAVKALEQGAIRRIFYLSAKTVGKTVAEKAFMDMRQAGVRLRTLSLTAKEKLCFNNGQPCEVRSCPYAIGYYDRVRNAMRRALAEETLTRSAIERVAGEHQVCPAALCADVSSWTDAIICDYNYVFDPKVYLRSLLDRERGGCAFLIDEAHNLVDRSREMFSADLGKKEFLEVRNGIKNSLPHLTKRLAKIVKQFAALEPNPPLHPSHPPSLRYGAVAVTCHDEAKRRRKEGNQQPMYQMKLPASEGLGVGRSMDRDADSSQGDLFRSQGTSGKAPPHGSAFARKEPPLEFVPLLKAFLTDAEAWLTQNKPAQFREALLSLYFRVSDFLGTLDRYDERYVTIVETLRDTVRLRLFCLEPASLLQEAIKRGRSAIFFSATLSPMDYFHDIFGRAEEDEILKLASPFPGENLRLLVADHIATDFKRRTSTVDDVARAIDAVVQCKQGNYLVYFPSHQYLTQVLQRFQQFFPSMPVIAQSSGMTEDAREAFLQAFRSDHAQALVGFAVMGGIFGEGIDLVGDRLVGAVVVGVGLPQLCLERDLIRDYFEAKNSRGFDYAYAFPGMTRVFQAVGRVIRSEKDRGVVLLIDTRFAERRYGELFPQWWRPHYVRTLGEISEALGKFWADGANMKP